MGFVTLGKKSLCPLWVKSGHWVNGPGLVFSIPMGGAYRPPLSVSDRVEKLGDLENYGAACRTRTYDPRITNYQMGLLEQVRKSLKQSQ